MTTSARLPNVAYITVEGKRKHAYLVGYSQVHPTLQQRIIKNLKAGIPFSSIEELYSKHLPIIALPASDVFEESDDFEIATLSTDGRKKVEAQLMQRRTSISVGYPPDQAVLFSAIPTRNGVAFIASNSYNYSLISQCRDMGKNDKTIEQITEFVGDVAHVYELHDVDTRIFDQIHHQENTDSALWEKLTDSLREWCDTRTEELTNILDIVFTVYQGDSTEGSKRILLNRNSQNSLKINNFLNHWAVQTKQAMDARYGGTEIFWHPVHDNMATGATDLRSMFIMDALHIAGTYENYLRKVQERRELEAYEVPLSKFSFSLNTFSYCGLYRDDTETTEQVQQMIRDFSEPNMVPEEVMSKYAGIQSVRCDKLTYDRLTTSFKLIDVPFKYQAKLKEVLK